MQSKIKILLCEDEHNIGNILKELLENQDYEVDLYLDGESASMAFCAEKYDLCLLDVMMPHKDGFTLGREIREKDREVPIIYLTALGQKEDVNEGLRIGADDYITKPFSMEELQLRIQAVLRRSYKQKDNVSNEELPEVVSIGIYEFNRKTHILSARLSQEDKDKVLKHWNKKFIPQVFNQLVPVPNMPNILMYKQKLTTKEYDLLNVLCVFKNQPLERHVALQKVWGRTEEDSFIDIPTQRNMDVYINKLRRMLFLDPNIEIKNIHGKGYILIIP